MNREDKKAAISAYKERKPIAGIFALRCISSGQIWVGRAPDLATIQNRIWYTLRHGGNPNRAAQAAWNAHGAEAFTFEILERIDEKLEGYLREAALKERHAHWQGALNAAML